MRAIIFNGESAEFIADYPVSQRQANESLIEVQIAALCSTDREILRGYRPDFKGVLGHEFVGIVRESDTSHLIGQRVVGEINLSCGTCLYCLSGRANHCSERLTLGINHKDGACADFLTLPTELLHVVPDGLPSEIAVFCEPLAAALRITEQVDFPAGVPVAIVGDGRLALMICQALAASTSAVLTVIGRHPEKLELFAPWATTLTKPQGSYEVVIDASGSPESLALSIALTRSEGTLVMKSTYAGTASIDMSEVVVRELRIQGSRCGPFEPALRLLDEGRVALPPIELYAPEDSDAAFASRAFKAAFDFRR
ncbi:MAG: alcohol dehydrogenase catalytic domain-containing protein [Coriobacteriales bacterium]|jgi:threonine dehydrogenase-like Zn-dependent dehydrogenase|nr:alcohol dehydrogenase catalytic domain-containing protein [Coriobacteriales bacterium]